MSTIKFGIRSVKLQSYSPKELGLDKEIDSELKIEYRQNYFHLHFLPVFPTSKILRFRRTDKQLYEVPENIKSKILFKIKEKPRTPWYTFLAPLILIIGLSIYFGKEKYKDYQRAIKYQNNFLLKTERAINSINKLNTNTYLELGDKYAFHNFGLFAKVEKIKNDSILLLKLDTDLRNEDDFLSYQVKKFYLQNKNTLIDLDSTWTTKKILTNGILKDFKDKRNIKVNRIKLFDKTMTILDGNEILNIPLFKTEGYNYKYIKNGKEKFDLINFGITCNIKRIENIKGNLYWGNNFPMNPKKLSFENRETFRLNFENFEKGNIYHSKIHLIDNHGINHVFNMEIGKEIQITNANNG